MEAIFLSILVLVALGFCATPVLKESIVKSTLRSSDLFKEIEESMSYEEVCEVMACEAISHKEIRVGIRRRQEQYIWDFEEVNGKMYKLIANFEQDMLITKDIICD